MSKKGYKQTKEHIRKRLGLSKGKTGRLQKGNKNNFYNKHHTESTKKRISEKMKKIMIGNNYGKGNKGKIRSEEAKRKNREAHKGKYHSEETKKKMCEMRKGERNSNWLGGISFEPYTIDWNITLKRAIRERDNYICQICSQYGNMVHHKDYNKLNCNPSNLIILCRKCHTKTNYNRNYWIKYFNQDP